MFVSRILAGFDPNTPLKYVISGRQITDIKCVRDWLNNGLCAWAQVEAGHELKIENGAIVIEYD